MTLVSSLRLSKGVGMICADERITTETQHFDVHEKITKINDQPIFMGYSGSVTYHKNLMQNLLHKTKKRISYDSAVDLVNSEYKTIKDKFIKENILDKYNVSLDEILSSNNIDPELKKKIQMEIEKPTDFDLGLMISGYSSKTRDFEITQIVYPGVVEPAEITESIGGGSDKAEEHIMKKLKQLNRNNRKHIEKYMGARIMIGAVQYASDMVSDVGGAPQLIMLDKTRDYEIGEEECILLSNMLTYEKHKYFNKHCTDIVFQRIINDNAKAEDVVNEMLKSFSDPKHIKKVFKKISIQRLVK